MNDVVVRRALRVVALAIAVAAVIDPAITSRRSAKPVVIVSALDSVRDASLADRVSKAIGKRFTVVRSNAADAGATVIVGDGLPNAHDDYPSPAFAIAPDSTTPSVSIERVDVPTRAPADARVPVLARVRAHGANGRSLEVTLRVGTLVADRVTRRFARGDSTLTIPLSFIPAATGPSAVQVTATLSGVRESAVADAAVNVVNKRWSVLFFDPRPSWMSTFVRRAVENDARFMVTSRIVTSRNVGTDAGRPPAALSDLASLAPFDAVVIGAPEGLSSADAAGLESFMRKRGGSVVLLLDQRVSGAYDRLTGVAAWSATSTSSATLASTRRDSSTLRATEIAWPSALPAGATSILGGAHPAVWESPIGAGRLVVSGALDAWRFRDPSTSKFDQFWRELLADAADASPAPLWVDLSTPIAAPGDPVDVRVVIRDAALQPAFVAAADSHAVRASVVASLEAGAADAPGKLSVVAPSPVRLWAGPDVGELRGTVRAPQTPGTYRIVVVGSGGTASAPLIVAPGVRRAAPSNPELLAAWATSRGGRMLRASDVGTLSAALTAAVHPSSRIETWHPMRSAWWIVPFVLALSGEWWLRRRRGLP